MLTSLRSRLIGLLGGVPASRIRQMVAAEMSVSNVRSYPLQKADATRFLLGIAHDQLCD